MSNFASAEPEITYRIRPDVACDPLNALFDLAWPRHVRTDFGAVLAHSLTFACAYQGASLVGFVRLAWDGGRHVFVLDPTVHPEFRRRGIGRELVRRSVEVAAEQGIEWVHVDFEPALRDFYDACGFRPTEAGLIRLEGAGRRTVP